MTIRLIGTLNSDPDGASKLERELEAFRPEIVLLEGTKKWSEAVLSMYQATQEFVKRRRFRKEIGAAITDSERRANYQLIVTSEYCDRSESELLYFKDPHPTLDIKKILERKFKDLGLMWRHQDRVLGYIAQEDTRERAKSKEIWDLVRKSLGSEAERFPLLTGEIYELREAVVHDTIMERTLREVVQQNPDARIAGIIRAGRLMLDPEHPALYRRIQDLRPERKFLYV